MTSIYSKVLSIVEKVLQDIVKEYKSIEKSLQNIMEDQNRNIAQLVRIGAVVEQRWGSKKDLQDDGEKSEDKENREEEGPKNNSRKS